MLTSLSGSKKKSVGKSVFKMMKVDEIFSQKTHFSFQKLHFLQFKIFYFRKILL
jgi:hypothetical protein